MSNSVNECDFHMDMSKEEWLEQQEFEERVLDSMIHHPPFEVVTGNKAKFIEYLAKTAVELFEGRKGEDNG